MKKREIKTTLAIDGEKKLKSALSDAARNMRILATESKATTSAFGDNAKSIDGLSVRNENLSKQIEQQEEIVRALNKAVEESTDIYGEADKRTDGYKIRLNNATAALNKMKNEVGSNSDAIQNLHDEMKSKKIDKFTNALKKVGKVASKTVTAGLKAAAGAATTLGVSIAAAGAKIIDITEDTREYRADMAKLEQNAQAASVSFKGVKTQLSGLTALTGEADSSVEALSNLMATGFDNNQMTKAVDTLSGAVIKFPDTLKIESLADGLQETLATGQATGQFGELIERMGGNLETFNKQLGNATTASEKQSIALDWLANSGLATVNEEYRKTNKEMLSAAEAQFALNDAVASLGTAAEPTIAKLKGGFASVLTSLVDMLNGGAGSTDQFVANIKDFANTAVGQMQKILPVISTFLSSFVGAIVESLPATLPLLMDGAFDLIDGLLNAIVANVKPISKMVSKLMLSFSKFLIAKLPLIISTGVTIITALITGIADGLPEMIPAIVQGLMDMVQAVIDKLPLMLDAGLQLIMGLAEGIIAAIPTLIEALPRLIDSVITFLLNSIPQIIDAGVKLLTALVEALPTIIEAIVAAIPKIIDGVITAVIAAIPLIIDAGIKLLVALIKALPKIIQTIVAALPKIIKGIVNALIDNIDKIILAGVQLFVALIENMPAIIAGIVEAIPQIIVGIIECIGSFFGDMADVGLNLIKGLWRGISDAGAWIWRKIRGFFSGIVDGIKDFFGIHSPSTLFAGLGGNMAEGVGVGFADQMKSVASDMENAIPTTLGATDVNVVARNSVKGYKKEAFGNSGLVLNVNGPVHIHNDDDIRAIAQKLETFRRQAEKARGGQYVYA